MSRSAEQISTKLRLLSGIEPREFKVYTERQLDKIEQLRDLSEEQRFSMHVVANVLPFRVNNYVIEELIDWSNVPDDPMFQLSFPQPGMLKREDFNRMAALMRSGADKSLFARQVERYADVYTSRVSNLLYATPHGYLRAFRSPLPHD